MWKRPSLRPPYRPQVLLPPLRHLLQRRPLSIQRLSSKSARLRNVCSLHGEMECIVSEKDCKNKRSGMMKWMQENKDKWEEFLSASEFPKYPDFGSVMRNGCPGFASEVLHWPTDMILGGAKRSSLGGPLAHADALQSVFLVASPNDVYLRYKDRVCSIA